MHAAPSVTFPVGRSAFAGLLLAAVALAGFAAAAAWTMQAAGLGPRQLAAFGCATASGAFAIAMWVRSPRGTLRWDGVDWHWQGQGWAQTGRVELALDLQSRLLLRWHPQDGRPQWLWLERKSAFADWDALRRAVYSRAEPRKPVPQTGEPPAAEQ